MTNLLLNHLFGRHARRLVGDGDPAVPAVAPGSASGIRPAGTAAHDQARVATPASALAAGATHLVVGRAITKAPDPAAAAAAVLREMAGA